MKGFIMNQQLKISGLEIIFLGKASVKTLGNNTGVFEGWPGIWRPWDGKE